MALDGKFLALAKAELKEKRRQHDIQYDVMLKTVYAKSPRIRELDDELKATMAELFTAALTQSGEQLVEDIRVRNLLLQQERRSELSKIGFSNSDFGDDYMCSKCSDSGYVGTEICSCLFNIYKNLQKESLSYLFKLGNETFDNFDLSFYDDFTSIDSGISARRAMEIIYETCVEYARKFGHNSINLFFNGAPGLGKTFLSACVAKVVSENGYSVVYDTASALFLKFGDAMFCRPEERDDFRAETARYLACDLLIIDDLGTELTTSVTISTLYDVINTRLISDKKTIVNSNLTITELRQRYSEQIMSRLEGEYQVLTFRGEDIRKKKNTF
jgi:DNA replication protein DnaC